MGDARAFLRHALLIAAGPLIWAAHFTIIYVWTALFCARGGAPALIPGGIAIATAIAVCGLVALGLRGSRAMRRTGNNERFLPVISAALAALALVGVLWNGLPAVLVSACS